MRRLRGIHSRIALVVGAAGAAGARHARRAAGDRARAARRAQMTRVIGGAASDGGIDRVVRRGARRQPRCGTTGAPRWAASPASSPASGSPHGARGRRQADPRSPPRAPAAPAPRGARRHAAPDAERALARANRRTRAARGEPRAARGDRPGAAARAGAARDAVAETAAPRRGGAAAADGAAIRRRRPRARRSRARDCDAAATPAPPPAGPRSRRAVPHAPRRARIALWAWFTGGNALTRIGVVVLFFGVAFLLKYFAEHFTVPIELRLAAVAGGGFALIGARHAPRGIAPGLRPVAAGRRRRHPLPDDLRRVPALRRAARGAGGRAARRRGGADGLARRARRFAAARGAWRSPADSSPRCWSATTATPCCCSATSRVLNAAIFALAWSKAWRALNAVGFVFTFVLGLVWGHEFYAPEHYATVQPFLALFFVFYVAIAILYARRGPLAATGSGRRPAGVRRSAGRLRAAGGARARFRLRRRVERARAGGRSMRCSSLALRRRARAGFRAAVARVPRAGRHLRDDRDSVRARRPLDRRALGGRGGRRVLDRRAAERALRAGLRAARRARAPGSCSSSPASAAPATRCSPMRSSPARC